MQEQGKQEFNIERPSLISDKHKTKWRKSGKQGELNWMKPTLIKGSVSSQNKKPATKGEERKSMSVIRTTNKTRRQQNIKWEIYSRYILATSASQTLACYKISWQYGLLFGAVLLSPTHSSCRRSRSPFLLLLGYTVPHSGLFSQMPDLAPKTSLSHSWNPLAIKTKCREK